MLDGIALICVAGALIVLIALSVIDLRVRLLPNRLVGAFAVLGVIFHLATLGRFVGPLEVVLGGISGFMTLFLIRAAANHFYGEDALGLGDVKLMGAAGLWLGPQAVMLALSAGAFAALLHGLVYGFWRAFRTGTRPDFARLKIPAGPGFVAGIIAVWLMEYWRLAGAG